MPRLRYGLTKAQGRWVLGIFKSDNDLDCISDVLNSDDIKPLKHEVLRLRAKLWEQNQQEQQAKQANGAFDTDLFKLVEPDCSIALHRYER